MNPQTRINRLNTASDANTVVSQYLTVHYELIIQILQLPPSTTRRLVSKSQHEIIMSKHYIKEEPQGVTSYCVYTHHAHVNVL